MIKARVDNLNVWTVYNKKDGVSLECEIPGDDGYAVNVNAPSDVVGELEFKFGDVIGVWGRAAPACRYYCSGSEAEPILKIDARKIVILCRGCAKDE